MSQAQASATVATAAPKVPEAKVAKHEEAAAAEGEPVVSVGSLHFRRRLLRNKFSRYQKGVKELVSNITEPKEGTTEAESVNKAYQLLRVFSLTYNFIHLAKEENKAVIPADFSDELAQVLTAENFAKFAEAFKGPKDDYVKSLPDKVEKSVAEHLIKFVQVKEVDHITAKYETEINDLTSQIDARKNEPRPKQARRPRNSPKERSPTSLKAKARKASAEDDASLEDQMTTLLGKISSKSRAIRLTKGDFEQYSDAQSQFDQLFDDVATEILKMKRSLKQRFHRVQNGKPRQSRRRNNSEVHDDVDKQ